MGDTAGRASGEQRPRRSGLEAAFPLLVLTGVLFIAAGATFATFPAAGLGVLRIWGLFMTLGFIAAIGATLAWYFAVGPEDGSPSSPSRPAHRGERNVLRDGGRPAPSNTAVGSVAPRPPAWSEDEVPFLPARHYRPVPSGAVATVDVGSALTEINGIEDELDARAPLPKPRSQSPARP